MARESRRLIATLGDLDIEGLGIACVAGIDAAEAVRRLDAEAVDIDLDRLMAMYWENPIHDDTILTMGVTDVPGGCVLAQPWGYGPQMPGVTSALSMGTTCYAMYVNPKSGNQGKICRDGDLVAWDLHPGGGPDEHERGRDALLAQLYEDHALAYCFAYVGLRPIDGRAVGGPPDSWIRLPTRDYWTWR